MRNVVLLLPSLSSRKSRKLYVFETKLVLHLAGSVHDKTIIKGQTENICEDINSYLLNTISFFTLNHL